MCARTLSLSCIAIIAIALMLPCTSPGDDAPVGENLVSNPSIEEGADDAPADWRFWGWAPEGMPRTSTGVWDSEVARTGERSLKIVNPAASDVGTWTNREGDGFIPVEPGEVYTASAWMMVESVEPGQFTNFRAGFCRIDADGEISYLPADTRREIAPADGGFPEAGVWRRFAVAARAPTDATHIGVDIDLHGPGTAWIDDVAVTRGYDIAALGGEPPAAEITIAQDPDLDPPSADAPLSVTFRVTNGLQARPLTLECEVLDYWFRPSVFTQDLQLDVAEMREVTVEFDDATRARLFDMREKAGANGFRVTGVLRAGDDEVARTRKGYRFANRVREWEPLPPLPPRAERVDDLFGEQTLVDVINCGDPDDPHPYFEGGRGMGAKTTGAVPNEAWKDIYREPAPAFTTIETILGKRCRVTHGWGWFAYKFNRPGLKPGTPYLVVMEYPEDTGRTYNIFNTGISCSLVGGYGFHTGRTLGDHWTRTLNSEYADYPLSGEIRRWHSLFHLGEQTWAPGDPWRTSATRADSEDGFWFIVGGVGPSQDALASGAAVSTIKLYEISNVPALFPRIEEPPLELGRREMFVTAESDGVTKYLQDEESLADWARVRLHDARFMGLSGVSPNRNNYLDRLLQSNREEGTGLRIFPRWMIEREVLGKVGVPPEGVAKGPDGEDIAGQRLTQLPDILHPNTLREVLRLITEELSAQAADPALAGMMLYKHYGSPIPVSFSDYALGRFEEETDTRIEGADSAARRAWLLANRKEEYYRWWYAHKREFLLAIRDHLRALRPDLKLFYFPWHSDDDFPFSCGRLRYAGEPMMDRIYVPGTNILLVPSFTVPPEQWTEEQKRNPFLARSYYRERIAPELEGQVTIEDVLYGRYKDMPQFWGAPRSGELPHLLYPDQMDLIAMFTEPGGIYANHVGYSPRLFREDDGIVYWAPVRYTFTADNPQFLDLFRTGEGSAIAVHMPYNEETTHLNVPSIHGALGVEHGGPFCMMEEVLSMAHSDPVYIMESMWEPLKRGFPHHARAFAQAYRALPALPTTVLEGAVTPADEAIVVRSCETDYGQYLAVINTAFDLRQRQVALTITPAVQAVERVVNLGTGEAVPFADVGDGRIRIDLPAPPMSLTSLRVIDRVPRAVVRDIRIEPEVFSPNGDGAQDTVTVTGRTVMQIAEGRWSAEIIDGDGRVVRRFEGDAPRVQFAWDGLTDDGERCADGDYDIRFVADAFPEIEQRRGMTVDTRPPETRVVLEQDRMDVPVNNVELSGRLSAMVAGESLHLLREGMPDRTVPLGADGSFTVGVEGLNLGDNTLSLVVRDRAGNATEPASVQVRFALDMTGPIGFDFGAGPIMEGFSAIRNDTRYSPERGYGWIKYDNVWKGDRGVGDHLIRDYCSGGEDREWAVALPDGSYTVTVVMVDTLFDQFTPDIYLEGEQVFESTSIRANEPIRPSFQTQVSDGLLNCEFINPGGLPYFALNGIIIERN